jgi:hypothetical protein
MADAPIYVQQPYPLRTCPGRKTWERYRRQDYLVFVDESFFMFFEMTSRTGYFCHGGVGVPQARYDSLKVAVRPIFQDFLKLTRPELQEFKHNEFKRIEFRERKALAIRLRDVLRERGGFVTGFYTPVRSFVLERVRTEIMDEMEAIPEDQEGIYAATATTMKTQFERPGSSALVKELLTLPVVAFANMLAAFGCRFKIIYDPRDGREDKAVQNHIDSLVQAIKGTSPEVAGKYIGMDCSRRSEEEVGLQFADLVAGETKDFLEGNPEMQSYGARSRIITQRSKEPIATVGTLAGHRFKTGVLTKMPKEIQGRFFEDDPGGRYVFPCFTELLASGMLTCYSSWGTPRDLMIYEGLIWDQTDK